MRAFVTGADGFIGSHLCQLLLTQGHEVTALCQYNSFGLSGWLDSLPPQELSEINILHGDIRDSGFVTSSLSGVDVVYHLAALISIPYSYQAPSSYMRTNVEGTLNVLQSCLDNEVSRLIHTSTSECYGTAQYVPINESHPVVAQSPYAASKISADQFCLSYFKSFGLPVSILRPFNTYGPRQSVRAVIPSIITQILNGNDVISLGSLTPTRDFNFVLDTCAAFTAVAESNASIGKVLNSASNFEISIGQLVELIASITSRDIEIVEETRRTRPGQSEVFRLYGDNSLLRGLTNWSPLYGGLDGFRLGLERTIEWFSVPSNLSFYSPSTFLT